MNATHTNKEGQDDFLDRFISAARDSHPRAELDAATARFRTRLPRQPVRRTGRMLRWAGAAAAVMLGIAIVPQMMPGENGAAFAEVQAWFDSYRTVHVQTVTRHGEDEVSRMNIWATAEGGMRLETGLVTQILDPDERVMHTLLPGDRVMSTPIPAAGLEEKPGAIGLLHELRDFQGQATQLSESRVIDGEQATGYELRVDRTTVKLWAASRDNRPMLMEVVIGDDLVMESHMVFDQPLPEDALVVPAGYQPVSPDA